MFLILFDSGGMLHQSAEKHRADTLKPHHELLSVEKIQLLTEQSDGLTISLCGLALVINRMFYPSRAQVGKILGVQLDKRQSGVIGIEEEADIFLNYQILTRFSGAK